MVRAPSAQCQMTVLVSEVAQFAKGHPGIFDDPSQDDASCRRGRPDKRDVHRQPRKEYGPTNSYQPTGFSLVELLVVISILALLMMLMVPAIMSAREGARRSLCGSNQARYALGMAAFDTRNGMLPGWRNPLLINGTPNNELSEVTWLTAILPHIERLDIYNGIVARQVWRVDYNDCAVGGDITEFARCPAAPLSIGYRPYKTHYRAGAVVSTNSSWPLNRDDLVLVDNVSDSNRVRSMSDLAAADGLSGTLLVSEGTSEVDWIPWNRTIKDMTWNNNMTTGNAVQNGGSWAGCNCWSRPFAAKITHSQALGFGFPVPSGSAVVSPNERVVNGGVTALASPHPRGVNVAFADGHVKFIADDILPRVYGHLATARSVWNGTGYPNNSALAVRYLMSGSTPATEPFVPKEGENF